MATYSGQTTGTQAGDIAAGYIVNGAYLSPGATIKVPTATSVPQTIPAPTSSSSGTAGAPAPVSVPAPVAAPTASLWSLGQTGGTATSSYIQFAGSPDIFDKTTGTRITEAEAQIAGIFGPNGTLNNVQTVATPRPGITTAEQFSQYSGKNVTVDELAGRLPDTTPTSDTVTAGAENPITSYREAVTSTRAATSAASSALAQFQLLDAAEIKSIATNPDLTKALAARRISFINDPQSEYWLQRMTLQNELNSATRNEQIALENYNMLKPDLMYSKVDNTGTLHNYYANPLNPKEVSEIQIGATGQFAEAKDKKVVWQHYDEATGIMSVEYEDGVIERKQAGTPKAQTGDGSGFTPLQLLNSTNQIQDNYRQDASVKNFQSMVNSGIPQVVDSSTNNPGSLSDTLLMRALAKVTDPTTGVREGEYATFEDAQGALNKIFVMPKAWIGKGRLTDIGRKAMISEIQSRFNASQAEYDSTYDYYSGQVGQFGGTLPPKYGEASSNNTSVSEQDVKETVVAHYKEYTSATREELIQKLIAQGADKDVAARYVYQYLP